MDNEKGVNKRQFPGFILKQRSDGAFVIRPIGVTGERVKKDPAYSHTMRNASEFGTAARIGKKIRTALRSWLARMDQRDISSRLVQVLLRIIKGDQVNPLNSRKLIDGPLDLLNGFQVNKECSVHDRLMLPMDVQTGSAGQVMVTMPAFIPADHIRMPMRFKFIRLVAIMITIDLATDSVQVQEQVSPLIPFNHEMHPAIELINPVDADKGRLCILAMGLQCYLEAGNDHTAIEAAAANATAVGVLKCWKS